jgi:transposase
VLRELDLTPDFVVSATISRQWIGFKSRLELHLKVAGLTWIVERTFAWIGRYRRMSKDYECRVLTSETLIDLVAIRLMLNRLTKR